MKETTTITVTKTVKAQMQDIRNKLAKDDPTNLSWSAFLEAATKFASTIKEGVN